MFYSIGEASGYLSALIDGEGSVYGAGGRRAIFVYNTEVSIVEACLAACEMLGIAATAKSRENAAPMSTVPMWTVAIYGRANLEAAARLLRLRSTRKREALLRAISSYSRREPVSRIEFESMLRAGLTHREMAVRLGYKSHGTVQHHLKRLGILTPHRIRHCTCRACTVGRDGFEAMLARGMTRSDISHALGYKTQSAITYHFKRLGVSD